MEDMPLAPEPCRCPTPEQAQACLRRGGPMTGRWYELCSARAPAERPVTRSTSEAYRRRWDGLPQADEVRRRSIRCEFRSVEPTGREEHIPCCPGGQVTYTDVYACACPARGGAPTTLPGCLRCEHHRPIDGYRRQPGDPACGLVIGSCGYPALLELQVRAARLLCGETLPILISDDTDDAEKAQRIYNLATKYPNVTVWRNAEKMGHAPGDVAALWKGLQWGAALKLRVLCKLSNRFVPLAPRWLQDGAQALLRSGHPISSQPCLQGEQRFAFRSEALLIDVAQWHRPDVLAELEPSRLAAKGSWTPARPSGMVAEAFLWGIVDRLWGGRMQPWALLSPQRYEARSDQLWHCCDSQRRYEQVARDYGLSLDGEAVGLGG